MVPELGHATLIRRDFPPGFRCARSFRDDGTLAVCPEHPRIEARYPHGVSLYYCDGCIRDGGVDPESVNGRSN